MGVAYRACRWWQARPVADRATMQAVAVLLLVALVYTAMGAVLDRLYPAGEILP